MAAHMAPSLASVQPAVALLPQQLPLPQPHARLDAYKKVLVIFMQGAFDVAKEEALVSLRSALSISEQEHLSVRAAAMADAQHHLQLHPPGSMAQAGGGSTAPELSVGHSSQPLPQVDAKAVGGAGAKRAAPSSASKAVAVPRKRTRAGEGGSSGGNTPPAAPSTAPAGGGSGGPKVGAGNSRSRTQTSGAAAAGPRAAASAGASGELDPLVGRVVLRHWPNDGGWFRGIVSDFRPATGEHCIVYSMGDPNESFEWYKIRGASAEDCVVQEERVDIKGLGSKLVGTAAAAGGAAAGGGSGSGGLSKAAAKKPASGAAAAGGGGGPPRGGAAAAGKQQANGGAASRQQASAGAGAPRSGAGASKAGASRQTGGAGATVGASSKASGGSSKPAAASSRAAAAKPAPPPAAPQQQPAQPPVPAAPQPQAQQPAARNGKTHTHSLNGLTSHAAAVKQVLAAGGRPHYLNGHTMLPRRTRNWSSDEDDSDSSDDE